MCIWMNARASIILVQELKTETINGSEASVNTSMVESATSNFKYFELKTLTLCGKKHSEGVFYDA